MTRIQWILLQQQPHSPTRRRTLCMGVSTMTTLVCQTAVQPIMSVAPNRESSQMQKYDQITRFSEPCIKVCCWNLLFLITHLIEAPCQYQKDVRSNCRSTLTSNVDNSRGGEAQSLISATDGRKRSSALGGCEGRYLLYHKQGSNFHSSGWHVRRYAPVHLCWEWQVMPLVRLICNTVATTDYFWQQTCPTSLSDWVIDPAIFNGYQVWEYQSLIIAPLCRSC